MKRIFSAGLACFSCIFSFPFTSVGRSVCQVRVPLNTIRLGLDSIQQEGQMGRVGLDEETSFVVTCMDEAVTTMSDTLNDVLSYQKVCLLGGGVIEW